MFLRFGFPRQTSLSELIILLQSFIGGFYVEQGLNAVRKWLDPLFRPYGISAYKLVRQQHGIPPEDIFCPSPRFTPSNNMETAVSSLTTIGHLALFNQQLQKTDRQFEWIYSDVADDSVGKPEENVLKGTKTTPVWFVKVMVDGELYGRGRGSTKKAARNEAAKLGLERLGIFVW